MISFSSTSRILFNAAGHACRVQLQIMHIIDYVRNCVMGLHIDEYFAHVVNFCLGPVCRARP